jgi:peptidoglycan/xylan/chitin deacetylase (PgdA/CDA1 family)
MPAGLPILMFHALDDAKSSTCFPLEQFRRALAELHAHGYRSLRFSEAAARLQAAEPLPARSVVLTFDDGDATVYQRAWPILQEHGMSATVFVLPEPAPRNGRTRSFLSRRLLTTAQIRELHAGGIEIGAHSLRHPLLIRLPEAAIAAEIGGSRAALEDLLGVKVTSFAYPYGRHDRRCRRIVGQHFAYACSDRLDLARPGQDPLALPRVEACYLRSARRFDLLFSTRLAWYLRLRRVPRLVRHALLAPFPPRHAIEEDEGVA